MNLFEIKRTYRDSLSESRSFVAANSILEALDKYANSRLFRASEIIKSAKDMVEKNYKYEDGSECDERTKKALLETSTKQPIQFARENIDLSSIELVGTVIQ